MNKDFRHITIVVVLALIPMLAGGIIGGMIGYNKGAAECPQLLPADTTTIVSIDSTTIQGTAARPDTDSLIRIDSVPYPVPMPYPVFVDGETVIVHDTIEVYLTREHRLFSVQDTVDVWYSGVEPRIDSINVYAYHTTEIINQPYEVQVPKQPLLTLDMGIGNHQWQQLDPYVFAKATVSAGNWKIEPYAGCTYSKQAMFGISVSRSIVLLK